MSVLLALAIAAVPVVAADWKLVWSDEFEKPGLPDPAKWIQEEGYIRNGEKQFYTKGRRENARVEDGKLVIEARKDNFEGKEVTSASLTTEGKAEWTYGKFEVRAKLPTGRGTWPAIWMLGKSIRTVGWPKCGEIDIMENVGYDPDRLHGNIHTEAYNHTKGTGKGNNVILDKPYEKFYVYSCEWTPKKIDFFIDGKKYFTYDKEASTNDVWPFDAPHYLILNLAIGGGWGGQKGIDEAIYPAKYEIDYVRVYAQEGLKKERVPADVVNEQLDAYNKRDIDAFMAAYSPDVKIYEHPGKLRSTGHAAMRAIYASLFEKTPNLKATITKRIIQGRYIIDHESVTGFGGTEPMTTVAMYEVVDDKIANVWFVR